MNFDLRTFSLMIGIVNVLQLVVIFLQFLANKDYRGIGWYALGYASMAIGFLSLSLFDVRSASPIALSAMNTLVVSGFMFLYIGCMRFLGKRENRWIVIGVFAVFLISHSCYLYVIDDINARSAIRSAAIAIFSLLTAHGLFVHKNKFIILSANFTGAAFFIQGCFLVLHALMVLTVAPVDSLSNFFAPTWTQTTQFMLTLINSTLWMFGLIIMVNQRLNGELAESKEHIELIFNTGPDAAVVTQIKDGLIVKINSAFTNLTGFTCDETIGRSTLDVDIWEDPANREKLFDQLRNEGFVENFESVFRRKDGLLLFGMISAKIFTLGGEPHIISVTRNITDRKRIEDALRVSEETFRSAVQASPDGFVITDLDSRILMASPSLLRMGNHKREEDVVGHFGHEFYLPEDWPECQQYVDQLLRGELPGPKEFRALKSDKNVMDIESNGMLIHDSQGKPKALLYVMRDISERKLLDAQRLEVERKLSQAQKLESLAVMAGGIAHDFNNLLMGIMGNLEIVLESPDLDDVTKRRIQAALSGVDRSAELAHKILLYSGGAVYLPKELNLSEIFTENESRIRETISKTALLNVNIPRDLPSIRGQSEHLLRLMTNLVTNASESLGDEPGEITITMGVANCDEDFLSHSLIDEKPAPGEFAVLEVVDTGCGMDAEALRKLFDPFYTTKFWGRGLGMAEVMGVVKSHGGAIFVKSSVREGTCVRVFFPVSSTVSHTAVEALKKVQITEPTVLSPRTGKTVLVVDDEEFVRGMVMQRLEVLGYDTIAASDGEECVKIYEERSKEIDVVLLDFMMPRMNGVEAFSRLVALNSHVKVIMSTGYSQEIVAEMFSGRSPNSILHKPYNLQNLKDELERVFSVDN